MTTTLSPSRINGFPNPRCVSTGTVSAFKSRFAWVPSYVTGSPQPPLPGLDSFLRWTCPASDNGSNGWRGMDLYGNLDIAVAGPGYPVVAGQPITVTIFARSSRPVTSWRTLFGFHNGSTYVSGPTGSTTADTYGNAYGWVRLSLTTTVPAGATQVYIRGEATLTPNSWATGDTIIFSGIMIGSGGDYFDGSYSQDPALAPTWQGTANAGPSILSDLAAGVTVTDGVTTVGAVEIVASTLERNLFRTVQDLPGAMGALITSATPGLLEGQLVFLCASFARARALEALYKGTAVLTLATNGELGGLRHVAVDRIRLTAERALEGSPARWLLTVTVRERA